MTNLTLNKIQKIIFKEYIKNGYKKLFDKHGKIGDIAEFGLIVSEIGEGIMNELYSNKTTDYYKIAEECIDIIVRTLNFMSRKGFFNSESILMDKHKKNFKRGYLHGKRI